MNKTVKKIVEAVVEMRDEYDVCEDTALNILEIAAGGKENIPEFIENECCCDDDDCPECFREEEDDEDVIEETDSTVGRGDRVVIPKHIIRAAEEINGELNSKKFKFGEVTVVRYGNTIDVHFGDSISAYENDEDVEKVSLNSLNANGTLQFSAKPVFETGDMVVISVTDDGVIHID